MGDIKETLEKAEGMLCKAIDEISRMGNLDANSLEILGKATDAIKDIYEVKGKAEGGSYERYSDDGYGRRARDSRGRFMDSGYGDYNREYSRSYNNYGADYGHSPEEEKEFLRWKMNNAKSEQEREMLRRKLEQM